MPCQKHFNNSWRSSPRFYDSRNLGGWNFGNVKLGRGEIEVGEESFVFVSLFDTVEIREKQSVYFNLFVDFKCSRDFFESVFAFSI